MKKVPLLAKSSTLSRIIVHYLANVYRNALTETVHSKQVYNGVYIYSPFPTRANSVGK